MVKKMSNVRAALLSIAAVAAILTGVTGCGFGGGPRARWGYTPKGNFGNPDRLGTHSFTVGGNEGFGIFYTLRGGSIDMDHVRGAADMTRAAYNKAYNAVINKRSGFNVGPALEMTTNKVRFEYPADWDALPAAQRQHIAHQAALIIGPAVGYHSTLWHEMLTWKGAHFALIEPEHESAFSWDDLYSNVLGTQLAAEALKDKKLTNSEYNIAMTNLIQNQMKELQIVSKEKAYQITETVRGKWFTSGKLMRRNMNTGFDDGMIKPVIIPGFTNQAPISIPMPTLDGLEQYGLKVRYTISSVYLQNGVLKRMAGVKSDVEPLKDYPAIMKKIEREAVEKYNYQIK